MKTVTDLTNKNFRTKSYKGFIADIYWSEEDCCYIGKLIGIRDTVHFTCENPEQIEQEFQNTVDDYLDSLSM
jgi:predicted HicB family RNase H-like nuclease